MTNAGDAIKHIQDEELKEERAKIKHLESVIEQQQKRLDKLANTKWSLPKASKSAPGKGAFTRVIIPDTHGAKCDKSAVAATLQDLSAIVPSEVIWLGDHLDCGGFLAEHFTIGYVAERDYTFEDDINATNVLLDKVQKILPKAKQFYIEGNHEHRVERWCNTVSIRSQADAKYLLKVHGFHNVLHLEKRGFETIFREKVYNTRQRGIIKLGNCHFAHGWRTGKYAARRMLEDVGGNVCYGHVHTKQFCSSTTAHDELAAWSPGCLCEKIPLYMDTNPTDWTHGYAVQLVQSTGDFLHITVPIIDGRSYLMRLLSR